MPLGTFCGHLVTERDNYMKLVPTPNNEARSWDLSTVLDVLENFKSLEALQAGQEWGPCVLTKCSCESVHLHGCCHHWHSVLMWLLANPEHCIPQQFIGETMDNRKKCSSQQIVDADEAKEPVEDDGSSKWKAKTVSYSELEDSEEMDGEDDLTQGKRHYSQPDNNEKTWLSQSQTVALPARVAVQAS